MRTAGPAGEAAGTGSNISRVGERIRGRRTRLVLAAVLTAAAVAACASPGPGEPPPIAVSPAPGGPEAPPVVPLAPGAAAPGTRGGLLAPLPAAGPRSGPRICEKFRSAPVAGGRYEVQNNAWGADTPQCTTAFDTGFSVQASHAKDSGPAAYPSIVYGCNYGTCTRGTPFPRPVADLGDVRSSWAVTTPGSGDYNVAYDVWLDPTARREGANTGAELMIWLDHTERVQPIGRVSATATVGGTTWDVWTGQNNGTPVISYVRQEPTKLVLDLPITDFVRDATRQGVVQPGWFLTNIQAGFEPWIGGTGLSTDAFAVTRNGV